MDDVSSSKEACNGRSRISHKPSYSGKKYRRKVKKAWTEEEDAKLFKLYKTHGSIWSLMEGEFSGRTRSEVKNRFYSTLRRVATRQNQGNATRLHYRKNALLQFVNDAILFGHSCSSKRGRKRKHPAKASAKERTRECAGKDSGAAKIFSLLQPCTSSAANEELSSTSEEWVKVEVECINAIRISMKLPPQVQGSAFVPFNKTVSV